MRFGTGVPPDVVETGEVYDCVVIGGGHAGLSAGMFFSQQASAKRAVGDDVILDKDGSPMLTPVGLVDTGRISADTTHSFEGTRTAAPGIAARFYMHRDYFLDDPDAFNTVAETFREHTRASASYPLTEAQASIAPPYPVACTRLATT
jgi:thioredoxin reductase